MKKYFETKADTWMSLLQIRLTPVSSRMPGPATFLLNKLARGLLPRFSRTLFMYDTNGVTMLHKEQAVPIKQKKNLFTYSINCRSIV